MGDFYLESKNTKNKVIKIIRDKGFYVERRGRDKYRVNYTFIVLLKYSRIYYGEDNTWFGLAESLFNENDVDFILFIIQDSDTVLITPFALMRDISHFVNLASSNLTYEIHVDPINYFFYETPWNLNPFLNNYNQLR